MANGTRQRLLDAAVELLLTEGTPGITTVRLTEKAGVVQSAFYNHFSSVQECKEAALREVELQVLPLSGGISLELQAVGSTAVEDVHRILTAVFDLALERPVLFRMLTHHHHEPEIGAMIDRLMASVRDDIANAILDETSRLNHLSTQDAETGAALLASLVLAALDLVLNGSPPDHVADITSRVMLIGIFGVADIEL
jgi:AcrR family transcriptional regulator